MLQLGGINEFTKVEKETRSIRISTIDWLLHGLSQSD
jgi:hypothetical protein